MAVIHTTVTMSQALLTPLLALSPTARYLDSGYNVYLHIGSGRREKMPKRKLKRKKKFAVL